MEDRKKILIPVGHEPETPHFDAEETLLSARPVVPITRAESTPVFNSPRAVARGPFYKRSLFLSLVVVVAVGIGLMAGLAIARYRYMQRNTAPMVAQPAQAPPVNDTRTAVTVQPEQQAPVPVLPEVKIEEKTTADNTVTDEDDDKKKPAPDDSAKAREDSKERSADDKDDNAKTVTPPVTREKKRADDANEGQDAPRPQRRERRVREREDEVDIPRRVERASEQINRIREIFEGRPQRP